MRRALIGIIAVGALVAWSAMTSAAACCDPAGKAACCEHAGATGCADAAKKCCGAESASQKCCDEQKKVCCGEEVAAVALLATGHQHESSVVSPTRQQVIANFRHPVRVGDQILMGKYVIEHDTERMASGLPCTQIYEFDKPLPVVAFHCVHLNRPYSDRATVTVRQNRDRTGMRELTEFQFKGEAAGHGVPTVR